MKQNDHEEQRHESQGSETTNGDAASQDHDNHAYELPLRKTGSRKKKYIVIATAIIIAVLVAVGGWYWFNTVNAPEAENEDAAQSGALTEDHDKLVFDTAIDLAGSDIIVYSSSVIGGQTESGQIIYEFAPYQVKGREFRSLPSEGAGKAFVSSVSEAEANIKKIDERLKAANFKQQSDSKDDSGSIATQYGATLVSYATYTSDAIVCALSRITVDSTETNVVGLGCSPISHYEKAAQAAAPIHEAYKKTLAATVKPSQLVYGSPDEKDGLNGKKRATIFQKDTSRADGTGISYYYSAGNEWKFLALAPKATLACSEFSAQDVKEAFRGIKCYDDSNKITEIK